jgi:hypothetical protein
MSLLTFGRPSYRWFAIALIVASAFYGWYVMVEYERVNELNERQLANTAADLKATLDTAMETVIRFNAKSKDSQAAARSDAAGTADQSAHSPLCDFDASQPYLDVAACLPLESQPPWDDSAIHAVATPALGIDTERATERSDPLFHVRADILFKELASVDAFELIFVANEDGDVLAQDAPAGRRWIRYLRWAEQTSRDAKADRSPTIRMQNVQEVVGGKDAWKHLRTVSSRTSVQLGGSSHQLYLQPVGLNITGWEHLAVGAVMPTSGIVREALAVDADLLALLLFVVLIGLLGFPFVKLAVIHRHERFGMRDVTRLYLSTGALLVLLTCGSFALDGYRRWHAEADDGLKQWAAYLDDSLTRELRDIRQHLVDYDRLLQNKLSGAVNACGTERNQWFSETPEATIPPERVWWPPRPPGSIYLRQVGWIRPDGQQEWKATADSIPGLMQLSQRPYVIAVQNNRLFQFADDAVASSSSDERPFFFGPDRSINDGKLYTFVSIQSSLPAGTCSDDPKRRVAPRRMPPPSMPSIVSATGLLLSLDRQPMPAGYGFALVNREGRVLYHSDRRLSLRENLFDELSQSARIRAMIYAGQSDYVTTRYRERAHQFYFKQVDRLERQGEHAPAGFFIATFRDTSVERAIVGHEFVAGLVGPMLVLLTLSSIGLALLGIVGRFVTEHRWGAWLWPHGGLDHVYKRQAIAFGVLLIVTLVVCGTRYAIVTAAFSPLAAAALGVAIYVHGTRHAKDRCRLTAVGWHAAALLLWIACLFVVPSAVLFRLALHQELGKLIQTEGAWIAAQRADASRDTEDDIPRGYYGKDLRCAHRNARRLLYSASAVPAPFGLPPETSLPREEPAVRLAADRRASERVDTMDATTGSCREDVPIPEMRATSGVSPSREGGRLGQVDRWLLEHLDLIDGMLPMENDIASRTHFQNSGFTYSPAGTLVPSLPISGIAVVALGLTLGPLVWWIRWNTNRLFLADYEASTPPPVVSAPFDPVLKQRTPEEQIVLLQIARERIANPGQRPVVERLLGLGLLRLCPDLRPWPHEFEEFLLKQEEERHAAVAMSEHVTEEHSWQSVRLILAMGVAGLGFFLVATQPGLQSTLLGIASGVTSALTTGLKLREALVSWLPGRKGSAA